MSASRNLFTETGFLMQSPLLIVVFQKRLPQDTSPASINDFQRWSFAQEPPNHLWRQSLGCLPLLIRKVISQKYFCSSVSYTYDLSDERAPFGSPCLFEKHLVVLRFGKCWSSSSGPSLLIMLVQNVHQTVPYFSKGQSSFFFVPT